jgi:CRISPR-associated endoribonuclease Cas6
MKPMKIYITMFKNEKKLSFNIDTPLSFKLGDISTPLPEPKLFFRSLHKKWNEYSENKFSDDLLDLVDSSVYIEYLDLKTDVMKDNNGITYIGSKGKVTFQITKYTNEDFVKYLNVLADFSYYAGVGSKVSMGMGQVHRVNKSLALDETSKRDKNND